MFLVDPLAITDGIIDSYNVAETEYPTWDSGTTYNPGDPGDRVIKDHWVFEAIVSHSNVDPITDYDFDTRTGTNWILVGPTNAWGMLDSRYYSTTSSNSDIVFTITPGQVVTCIGALGCAGGSITVEMTLPDTSVVYSETKSLIPYSGMSNLWEFFFAPRHISTQDLVFADLPSYPSASITVTITAGSGSALCSVLTFGTPVFIGEVDYGTSVGIQDYSIKEANEFGEPYVKQRKFSKIGDFDITFDSSQTSAIQKTLARFRATPILYVGSETREELLIFGFFREFTLVLEDWGISTANIEIEGLT